MLILIADDDRLARYSLKSMLHDLDDGTFLIFEATNGKTLVEQCRRLHPDVAFVDISMPHMDGLTAIEQCRQCSEDTQFVVVSGYSEFDYAKKSITLQVAGLPGQAGGAQAAGSLAQAAFPAPGPHQTESEHGFSGQGAGKLPAVGGDWLLQAARPLCRAAGRLLCLCFFSGHPAGQGQLCQGISVHTGKPERRDSGVRRPAHPGCAP